MEDESSGNNRIDAHDVISENSEQELESLANVISSRQAPTDNEASSNEPESDDGLDLNIIQRAMNEEQEKPEEENKSIYQTFMNVNSIFSRNFGEQKVKSRFLKEDNQEPDD